ncbi:MAG TPA: hypothetical protein VK403_01125, partial [Allosphingosinicella sp.]|nr:hypothetical protein [Allosphingosinicella sp.]
YFGGPEGRARFARELDTLVATAPLGPQDRFYFGELDPMSRVEHLPPGPSPRKVIPKTVHAAMAATDSVWEDILAHLNGEAAEQGKKP